MSSKYGPKAQKKIEKNLHEHKHDNKFESRDQAIAAALEQTRRAGGKAPKKKIKD
jgi:hypothetical protein